MNFFTNTLDSICTDPDSGSGYFPFPVGWHMFRPKVLLLKRVRNKII